MKPLCDVLLEFTQPRESQDNVNDQYALFHSRLFHNEPNYLRQFLVANMDEHRLHFAEKYADAVLRLTDFDDAMYFRHGVLRRELSGDMDYGRQRDHASHTLNNYLFGWYMVCHSPRLLESLFSCFKSRFSLSDKRYDNLQMFQDFGNFWPVPSLLHDVGYIFEGGLLSLDSNASVGKARMGAEYAQDFFSTFFWEQLDFESTEFKEKVRELTGVSAPQLRSTSLGEISNSLRYVGNMDTFLKCMLAAESKLLKRIQQAELQPYGGLLGDAFFLWENNYTQFGQHAMANKIKCLESAHTEMLREGIPGLGIRVLDHGVAGGMLVLLHSTLFYRFYFGLIGQKKESFPCSGEFWKRFNQIPEKTNAVYDDPNCWWNAIVWATGAAAIHNVQTMDHWPGAQPTHRQLKLTDDPFAYLGVLVDILQEWDRYTTSRDSIFTGTLPVSSVNVKVGVQSERICINYGNERTAEKVTEELTRALHGWSDLVRVS